MGATARWLAMLGGAALCVPAISHCGGQSARTGGDSGGPEGGTASGATGGSSSGTTATGGSSSGTTATGGGSSGTGGTSATGGSSSGRGGTSPTGGSSGTGRGGSGGSDPISLCRLPVESGPCLAYAPSFWFDAKTGVCFPFIYGGCDGNDNRFPTLEACYAACGGQGDRDDAACTLNTDCIAQRIAEPCCSTDVRGFVGVNSRAGFQCLVPELPCNAACPADCADLPQDGFIGATCDAGHCIPFDARERGFTSCDSDADCALVYGMGCCSNDCCSPGFCSGCPSKGCSLEVQPSKLVAIGPTAELLSLICDPGVNCPSIDLCDYPPTQGAACRMGRCTIVPTGAE